MAAKGHGKKFRYELASPFSVIDHWHAQKSHRNAVTFLEPPFRTAGCINLAERLEYDLGMH